MDLPWDGWYSAGEYGYQFELSQMKSIQDCLTFVLLPATMRSWGEEFRFSKEYKGRSLPMYSSAKLWSYKYYSTPSYVLNGDIWSYMNDSSEKYPSWGGPSFHMVSKQKLSYSLLKNFTNIDKQLNQMKSLHNNRVREILEEDAQKKKEEEEAQINRIIELEILKQHK